MTEKVLPYDRSVVPQETGYWCGPASTQVVLNGRGIKATEAELAREMGTTINGTNYVGLIERTLDLRVPDARYTSVYLERDPVAPADKERLWANLTRSIDAGFGVVMNWVSPEGNHPRALQGTSPAYRGTVYHYVAAMGYNDNFDGAGQRAVWIADSGFAPFGYWISFDQCATLIPPKGYAFADPTVAPTAPAAPAADLLMRVMGGSVPFARYQALLPGVARCFREGDINTVARRAMWIAQVGHESGGLRWQEEIADGSAYEGRDDLGNTQPGDGRRYKGRDFVQVTGRHNYEALSRWAFGRGLVSTPTYFVDNPTTLATDAFAFIGTTWYWTTQRPLNGASDSGDLELATRYINGGLNGLEDRRARYQRALTFGDQLLALSDIRTDTIEELIVAGIKIKSRSVYAPPGEDPIPVEEMIASLDAHGPHEPYIEGKARKGDPEAIRLLVKTAAGKNQYGDAAGPVNQALDVLAEISGKSRDEIRQQIQKGQLA